MNIFNFDNGFNKKALLFAFLFPFLLLVIHFSTTFYDFSIIDYGIYPLTFIGLKGVFFSPFIHSTWKHVLSNCLALVPLFYFLYFFYKPIFWKVLLLIILMSGFWTWLIGRPSFHIGASGVVNGLVTFLFFSGLFRKHKRLMGVSLIMVFIYGGILWGMFPSDILSWVLNEDVDYNQNISWEAHFSGALSGFILAYYFRNIGLKKINYQFDDSNVDDDNPYWLELDIEE